MGLRNTTTNFGSVARFFHWLIALLIIIMLIVGFYMLDIDDKIVRGQVVNIHKLTGITILTLVVLRLLWRWLNPVPVLPAMPPWELRLEQTVKVVLYLCLFIMPVSGWIFVTAAGRPPHLGSWTIPAPWILPDESLHERAETVHVVFAWILLIALCLHILGALKHHVINKDNVLRRMLPFGSQKSEDSRWW